MQQLDRYTDTAEAMTGGMPGLNSEFSQLVSLKTLPGNSMPVKNNISVQTGEEFSMKFLQECAASRVLTEVHGVTPNYEEIASFPEVQDRKIVYEELARVLGLARMDSECGSDITEYASAKGSTSHIHNGVHVSNESLHNMSTSANGRKPSKSTSAVCNDEASLVSVAPLLSQSDSSRSLCSDGSQSEKLKILCSFGGKILPRPSDGKLRYVGGETRIISLSKYPSWEELMKKIAGMCNQPHSIKYQLPGEDLDALISVSSDEDIQNMIDEYYGIDKTEGAQRLRIFLIPLAELEIPGTVDGNITQHSDTNYRYVFAVNGMVETDPNPLMPNAECNSRNEKVFPLPLHPLEIKDSLTEKSQTLSRVPSPTPYPLQQADMTDLKVRKPNNNSHGGVIESSVLSSTSPLPPEDSTCYGASSYHTPQVAVNLMKPHDLINKRDIVQPNMIGQLVFEGENLAPQRVEWSNRNSVVCSHDGIAVVEKIFGAETSSSRPDSLVELLQAPTDPVSSYHGIPHAFSDSKLQEQGEKSACPPQEEMTRSLSLNLGRPQSSFYKVSAAFPEKPVQLFENSDFIDTELRRAEPTIHVPVLKLKHLDDECALSFGPLNKFDADHHHFVSGENVCIRNISEISEDLTHGLKNANLKPVPCINLELPNKESQVCSSLAPASSLVDMKRSYVLDLNETKNFGNTSSGLSNGNLDSYSSWANNSEVAGLIHSSQQLSHDNNSCNTVPLNRMFNVPALPQTISHQSIEDLVDIGCQVPDVREHNLVGNAIWSRNPYRSALFEGEVSLLGNLSHYADHGVDNLDCMRNSFELQRLNDSRPVNSTRQVLKKSLTHNSPAEISAAAVPDVSDSATVDLLSPFEEAESGSPDLDSQAIFSIHLILVLHTLSLSAKHIK